MAAGNACVGCPVHVTRPGFLGGSQSVLGAAPGARIERGPALREDSRHGLPVVRDWDRAVVGVQVLGRVDPHCGEDRGEVVRNSVLAVDDSLADFVGRADGDTSTTYDGTSSDLAPSSCETKEPMEG